MEISLVFEGESPMVKSMNRSRDQRSSASAPASGLTALRTKADQGDAEVQFCLGLHYGCAVGAALDFAQAAWWYRKAADQDHTLAQYNLSIMFARGQGMPQDDAAAAGWIRKAAEGGDAGGQYHLGARFYHASLDALRRDARESRIEAFKWFHLAAAQGYRDSDTARQRVTLTMSRDEVDEGNHRAAAFVARKPARPRRP